MADNMSSVEINNRNSSHEQTPPPPPPLPSTPIQLRGFLTGDTIQVRGDIEDFNFSIHLNFPNHHRSLQFPQPSPNNNNFNHHISHEDSTFTFPPPPHHENNGEEDDDNNNDILMRESSTNYKDATPTTTTTSLERRRSQIVTRLRSGALSSTVYFQRRRIRDHSSTSSSSSNSKNRPKVRKRVVKEVDEGFLERVLRRRSLPLRPCNSYAFFVMATWEGLTAKGKTSSSSPNSSSFSDRSRELGKMWSSMEEDQKKVFEEMSVKDNARYKRQCILLKEETTGEEIL